MSAAIICKKCPTLIQDILLHNKEMSVLLYNYLSQTGTNIALEFWLEVELFRRAGNASECSSKASMIFEKYILKRDAQKTSKDGVDAEISKDLRKVYTSCFWNPNLFNEAQQNVNPTLYGSCTKFLLKYPKMSGAKRLFRFIRTSIPRGFTENLKIYMRALKKELKDEKQTVHVKEGVVIDGYSPYRAPRISIEKRTWSQPLNARNPPTRPASVSLHRRGSSVPDVLPPELEALVRGQVARGIKASTEENGLKKSLSTMV